MRLCATSVVWLKSGLGHLIKDYLLRENGKTNCRCRLCQERQESGEPSREEATIIRNERIQHLFYFLGTTSRCFPTGEKHCRSGYLGTAQLGF